MEQLQIEPNQICQIFLFLSRTFIARIDLNSHANWYIQLHRVLRIVKRRKKSPKWQKTNWQLNRIEYQWGHMLSAQCILCCSLKTCVNRLCRCEPAMWRTVYLLLEQMFDLNGLRSLFFVFPNAVNILSVDRQEQRQKDGERFSSVATNKMRSFCAWEIVRQNFVVD